MCIRCSVSRETLQDMISYVQNNSFLSNVNVDLTVFVRKQQSLLSADIAQPINLFSFIFSSYKYIFFSFSNFVLLKTSDGTEIA